MVYSGEFLSLSCAFLVMYIWKMLIKTPKPLEEIAEISSPFFSVSCSLIFGQHP